MRVRAIEAAELAFHWRRIEPLLAEALDSHGAPGRYLPIDILVIAGQGRIQAWVAEECGRILAVMLTTEVQYPRRKSLSIVLIAGERMSEWLDLWTETIEAHARARGCDHLEAQGRPGWARATRADVAGVMIYKDL